MALEFKVLSALALCCLLASGGFASKGNGGTTNFPVVDSAGTGDWALSLPIPNGWHTSGKVVWGNVPANPASLYFGSGSPDGREFVAWANGYLFSFSNSRRLGMAGKPPPQRPADFLLKEAVSYVKGGQYQVFRQEDTPSPLPGGAFAGSKAHASHSVLDIRFVQNGVSQEAEFAYDLTVVVKSTARGSVGNWRAANLTTVIARQGELDAARGTLATIMDGARLNPKFIQAENKVSAQLFKKWKSDIARRKAVNAEVARNRHHYNSDEFNTAMGLRTFHNRLFTLHETIRSYNTRVFNYMMGN